ncbi:MAG: hypothetical protein GKR87_09210 [Kiritimatiellae bacterium]|nr:hypothetical protein [Kiritimatiellia bacterium]
MMTLRIGENNSPEIYANWTPAPNTEKFAIQDLELTNGNFLFTIIGEPNRGSAIYTSDDLVTWTPFGFRLFDLTGTNTFELTSNTNTTLGFLSVGSRLISK